MRAAASALLLLALAACSRAPVGPSSAIHVVATDPDLKTIPAIAFTRHGDGGEVEMSLPASAPLKGPIAAKDWTRLDAMFDRALAERRRLDLQVALRLKPRMVCYDGVSVAVEAVRGGRTLRRPGDGCDDPETEAATAMTGIAVDALPACARVRRTWAITLDLHRCFGLPDPPRPYDR